MELCKNNFNFLGVVIGDGRIKLRPRIAKKRECVKSLY